MNLTCREVEEAIQGAWDRGAPTPLEGALEAHCRSCPTCEAWLARGRGWGAVLAGLRPVQVPTDWSEKVLAAWAAEQARPRPRFHWQHGLAWAAAVLVAASLVLWGFRARRDAVPAPPALAERAELTRSIREATSATLDLARAASEPAARVGIKFLAAATRPIAPGTSGTDSPPRTARPGVSEQVGRGIEPISSPVQKAFQFLLPPMPEDPADPSHRRT